MLLIFIVLVSNCLLSPDSKTQPFVSRLQLDLLNLYWLVVVTTVVAFVSYVSCCSQIYTRKGGAARKLYHFFPKGKVRDHFFWQKQSMGWVETFEPIEWLLWWENCVTAHFFKFWRENWGGECWMMTSWYQGGERALKLLFFAKWK